MLIINFLKTTFQLNAVRSLFLLLFVLLLMSSPAYAGTPIVDTRVDFTPGLYPGESATLAVQVSEIGGSDWVKDVTVSVQISPASGTVVESSSQGTSRIDKSTSKSFYFPVELSKSAASGTRTIYVTVKYYEMDLLNINTFGPYYIQDEQYFTVKNPYGKIDVTTTPSDVDIYLDGKYTGKSPMTISSVVKGQHNILLKKDGYNDISTSVNVVAGSISSVSKKLTQKTGSVSISTNPEGASVNIDRKYAGTSPLKLDSLKPGSHTISLSMNEYRDISDSFYITAGASTTYSKKMVKENGNIEIDSTPTGASVYLAGTYKGVTPLLLKGISPEKYNVHLTKEGYKDIDRSVTVNDGETTSVSISMDSLSFTEKVSATVSGSSASSSSVTSSKSLEISTLLPGTIIVGFLLLIVMSSRRKKTRNTKQEEQNVTPDTAKSPVIQNIHYGDRIETHIQDSVVQRSNIGSKIVSCPFCESTMPGDGNFCMACGKRIRYIPK